MQKILWFFFFFLFIIISIWAYQFKIPEKEFVPTKIKNKYNYTPQNQNEFFSKVPIKELPIKRSLKYQTKRR